MSNIFDNVKLTEGPEDDDKPGWGEYLNKHWRQKSLAVVASGSHGGAVLWTVGPHVQFELVEGGLSFDDIGFDPDPPPGISIWIGRAVGGGRASDGDYNDTELRGEFRPPTDDEWASIRAGECPWNEDAWRRGEIKGTR